MYGFGAFLGVLFSLLFLYSPYFFPAALSPISISEEKRVRVGRLSKTSLDFVDLKGQLLGDEGGLKAEPCCTFCFAPKIFVPFFG